MGHSILKVPSGETGAMVLCGLFQLAVEFLTRTGATPSTWTSGVRPHFGSPSPGGKSAKACAIPCHLNLAAAKVMSSLSVLPLDGKYVVPGHQVHGLPWPEWCDLQVPARFAAFLTEGSRLEAELMGFRAKVCRRLHGNAAGLVPRALGRGARVVGGRVGSCALSFPKALRD